MEGHTVETNPTRNDYEGMRSCHQLRLVAGREYVFQ